MGGSSDRRKFAAFLTDYVDYGTAMAALSIATYLPMFLQENGASPVVIGLIPAACALGRAITGLLAAPYLERHSLIRGRQPVPWRCCRLARR